MRFVAIDPEALSEKVMSRFFAQAKRSDSGCLIWHGATKYDGYGLFSVGQRDGKQIRRYAHRVSWVHANGRDVPEGLTIDHLCNDPSCVEATHLRPATIAENVLRSTKAFVALNARKTHCPSGHEYTGENVRIYRGGRNCRECNRVRLRARYARIGK